MLSTYLYLLSETMLLITSKCRIIVQLARCKLFELDNVLRATYHHTIIANLFPPAYSTCYRSR